MHFCKESPTNLVESIIITYEMNEYDAFWMPAHYKKISMGEYYQHRNHVPQTPEIWYPGIEDILFSDILDEDEL